MNVERRRWRFGANALLLLLPLAGCHSGGLDITCSSASCKAKAGVDLGAADLASSPLDLRGADLAGGFGLPTDLALHAGTLPLSIPKSGPPFSGAMTDPGLHDASQCPDSTTEPNDDIPTALTFKPIPDMPSPKIIKMAICPTGNNPSTGNHDVDVYKIDNSTGPASLALVAEIFYEISQGDLDVAIVDSSANVISEDGTAVSNGCAAAAIGQGVFYVVVVGANNADANNYQILINSFSTPQSCPSI